MCRATHDSWIPHSRHLRSNTGHKSLPRGIIAVMHRLHYVRSHGPVPALDWDSHRFSVTVYADPELQGSKVHIAGRAHFETDHGGELMAARTWTMDEMAYGIFPVCELQITNACDGSSSFTLGPSCLS